MSYFPTPGKQTALPSPIGGGTPVASQDVLHELPRTTTSTVAVGVPLIGAQIDCK